MLKELEVEEGSHDEILNKTGMANRLAKPDEIVKPLLFINSDMASFISGACIPIDFGNEAMIKTGKKHDIYDMKVGSKLFNIGLVQNQMKKQLEPLKEPEVMYDKDGIEIL